ncbi:MAG: TrmH family RNA methyltransferase [Candidatus Gracilibacteria bacterium]|nr:TrmH family RNA methyltransferase [Candidatus Gracilibacteria bacterium]
MSKIILLDSIRSMQNVGAIFRNADGAGFEKVILTGTTPTPPRNDISKTALGAEIFIDWEYYKDPFEILDNLRKKGYIIISVELDERSIDYTELYKQNNPNVVLVMGNEVSGVNKTILDISDEIVIIPMRGKKESLNVSVAAGIVMYSVN